MQGHSPLEAGSGAGRAASSTGGPPLGAVLPMPDVDRSCEPAPCASSSHSRRPGGAASLHGMQIHSHRRWASTPSLASATTAPTIPQADHRFDRSVRREGPEHQVARARGFTRDVAHFFVPHPADYDDVWVGRQKRPPRRCEGETDLRRDLDLAEAVLGDFHGVFGRPHFSFVGIDVPEPRGARSRPVALSHSNLDAGSACARAENEERPKRTSRC
jgi:hypothetical protein